MALILLLETATAVCSVGLARDGVLLSLRETDEGLVHGELLAPFIQEMLQSTGHRPADLAAVAVSTGPGSYTGLRVGLSTAKGIALGAGIPLIALPTLNLLAAAVRRSHPDSWIMPAIDARRQEVYAALYDPDGEEVLAPAPVVLDQVTGRSWLPPGNIRVLACGDGAAKIPLVWGEDLAQDSGVRCSAAHMAEEAQKAWQARRFTDPALAEPVYLKPAHVTTPVKGLLGRGRPA